MNVQFITEHNLPKFAILPYNEYLELIEKSKKNIDKSKYFPQAIMDYVFDDEYSLVKAWRLYKNLTQSQVAKQLGITQSAYQQIENSEKNQHATLVKLAKIFEIDITLLDIED